MFLTVVIVISPDAAGGPVDPEVVRQALLRHRPKAGEIEHIRVRTGTGEARIGVLSLGASQTDADRAAWEMCKHAIATEPCLSGWVIAPASGDR